MRRILSPLVLAGRCFWSEDVGFASWVNLCDSEWIQRLRVVAVVVFDDTGTRSTGIIFMPPHCIGVSVLPMSLLYGETSDQSR